MIVRISATRFVNLDKVIQFGFNIVESKNNLAKTPALFFWWSLGHDEEEEQLLLAHKNIATANIWPFLDCLTENLKDGESFIDLWEFSNHVLDDLFKD